MADFKLLKELSQAWGVAGREKNIRSIIMREISGYVDNMYVDNIGNIIAVKYGVKNGNSKKIMLSAHMDEIGVQVKKIEADGRIKLCKVGWVWTSAMYHDRIVFQNGTIGVVSCEGDIESAKNDVGKLYVDIGCTTKEETEKYVKVGDYAGFCGEYYELRDDKVSAKSFDDRAGCFMLMEAAKRNKGEGINDVYYVFSVQEEVGCRGAVTASAQIKPDMGISVDVTPDHFYPCDLTGCNAVGDGISVTLGDPSAMLDEYLTERMISCCEENGIKYQRGVMDRGGTDASSMNLSNNGVRVAGIALVDRYPHSQCSVISKKDVQAGIDLIHFYTHLEFEFADEAAQYKKENS